MQTFLVAAFAGQHFRGNPAGVCLPTKSEFDDVALLQSVARELNQPETAFVLGHSSELRIRWFSPKVEVALCGHATLAAAHVFWNELGATSQTLTFLYPDGELRARRDRDLLWLDFPANPGMDAPAPLLLLEAVSSPPINASRHTDRWIFEYSNARDIRGLRVNFDKVLTSGVRSLIATAPSDAIGFDIISRNFAPIVGVNEDQATGAAHCCLGPYWQPRLGSELRCWQASARGGDLRVRTDSDRVFLGGNAVTELAGDFRV